MESHPGRVSVHEAIYSEGKGYHGAALESKRETTGKGAPQCRAHQGLDRRHRRKGRHRHRPPWSRRRRPAARISQVITQASVKASSLKILASRSSRIISSFSNAKGSLIQSPFMLIFPVSCICFLKSSSPFPYHLKRASFALQINV